MPKKLTREDFEKRYWGKDAATVPAATRREFYSDYRESGMAFAKYKATTSQPYANPVTLLGAGGKRAEVAAAQKRITALYRLGYELNAKGWHRVDLIGQGSRLYGHGTSPSDLTPVSADEARRLNAYVAGNTEALHGLSAHERLRNPNDYLDMVERSARAVLNERIRAQGSNYHGDNERGLETALKMAKAAGCGPEARALVRKVLKGAPATALSPGIAFARFRAREARRKLGSRANSEDRVFVRNPQFRKRPAAYQMFGTETSRRGQLAEMSGKTRLDVAAKAHRVPFTEALAAFVRGSDEWEGEYHHVARAGNPHYAMPFGSAEEWSAILPAWRAANVTPPALKHAAAKARALGMTATIERRPHDLERGGFKGFLLVHTAGASYYVHADGKVTGGLSSQPEGKEHLRAALFGAAARTQNPKRRSTDAQTAVARNPRLKGWRGTLPPLVWKHWPVRYAGARPLNPEAWTATGAEGISFEVIKHPNGAPHRLYRVVKNQDRDGTTLAWTGTLGAAKEVARYAQGPSAAVVRTNPKARSTQDKAVLLHRWMDRQEAREADYNFKHAYKHKAGTPEQAAYFSESSRRRKQAHATRLKVAALNRDMGQGMSETTAMVRKLGHTIEEHQRRYNPAIKIATTRPATMTASAINKELDKLEAQRTALMHASIAAGRGHERPSDRRHMTDPHALACNAVDDRFSALRRECEARYGPRASGHLPRGYGPREKA